MDVLVANIFCKNRISRIARTLAFHVFGGRGSSPRDKSVRSGRRDDTDSSDRELADVSPVEQTKFQPTEVADLGYRILTRRGSAAVIDTWLQRALGQGGQSLLARDRHIGRIDAAAGVNVFPEVGGRDRLKRLLSHQRNIGCIDPTAGIDIAKQHAHGDGNVADVGAIVHAHQIDGDCLRVRHVRAVHGDLITGDAGSGRVSGASGGGDSANWSGESYHDGMVASRAAAGATFDAGCAN